MKKNDFKRKIQGFFNDEKVAFIMSAYDYAKYAHRNQERKVVSKNLQKEETRYFNHPRRIASELIDAGVKNSEIICIALLHDCLEDTGIFGNQYTDGYHQAVLDAKFRLTKAFNIAIADGVISLTIPTTKGQNPEFALKSKSLKFYKAILQVASVNTLLVKLFDRLDNIQVIEVKGKDFALFKLKETEEFYIPLFEKVFGGKTSEIQKIGYSKTIELKNLVTKKIAKVNGEFDLKLEN